MQRAEPLEIFITLSRLAATNYYLRRESCIVGEIGMGWGEKRKECVNSEL